MLSVSDTGVGLPSENADQIFTAFFSTKPEGSGMGLTISGTIVEAHGGRLWATANKGRGATFHFTVQTTIEARRVMAAENSTVFIIDDDAGMRAAIAGLLESVGLPSEDLWERERIPRKAARRGALLPGSRCAASGRKRAGFSTKA